MSEAETAELERLAAGGLVLELGAQFGHSAVHMAHTARRVVSVDWHGGDPRSGFRDTLPAYWENVRELAQAGRILPLVGRVEQALPLLRPRSFDLAFVDAGHDDWEVERDIQLSLPLLRPGGSLALHDWGWFGVSRGARRVLPPPGRVVHKLAVWAPVPGAGDSEGARPAAGGREG